MVPTQHYLSNTVGQAYDPPVNFLLKLYTFSELSQAVIKGDAQLVFGHASLFSCLESAIDVAALSTISRLKQGKAHQVIPEEYLHPHVVGRATNQGGGLIFAKKTRYDIQTLLDVRGKLISAVEPGSLLGLQSQWHLLREFGISLMNEVPKIYFTNSDEEVVYDILNGVAEVGMVPSGTIEGIVLACIWQHVLCLILS